MATPAAPQYLSPASQAWWAAVLDEFDLGPSELRLLEAAAAAWDRLEQARVILDAEGLTVPTATGLKTHPAAAIEVQSRIAFARLVRELRLESAPQPTEWTGHAA